MSPVPDEFRGRLLWNFVQEIAGFAAEKDKVLAVLKPRSMPTAFVILGSGAAAGALVGALHRVVSVAGVLLTARLMAGLSDDASRWVNDLAGISVFVSGIGGDALDFDLSPTDFQISALVAEKTKANGQACEWCYVVLPFPY